MTWRCVAEHMAPAYPGARVIACDAQGDTDKGAERHTKDTNHPTISGPNAAKKRTNP